MTRHEFAVFKGTGVPADPPPSLPPTPPWREFQAVSQDSYAPRPPAARRLWAPLGNTEVVNMVNAAIALRRPLLVSGKAGSGKSTLAEMIAAELSLGRVLHWPITSSSRLDSALYEYDAIGRVHEHERNRRAETADKEPDVGRYIRLGPLGTALLPWARPRVLLVDEIDKSDIDLPSDLLHVFERGEFVIPELARLPAKSPVTVMTDDHGKTADITDGLVRCAEFPIVVLTSNQERTFPAAFLRRCLRMSLSIPDGKNLENIVLAQIPDASRKDVKDILERFSLDQADGRDRAIDQVLNAIHVVSATNLTGKDRDDVHRALLASLDETDQ